MKRIFFLLVIILGHTAFPDVMTLETEKKVVAHIDKLIYDGLKSKRIKPNADISNEVFVRRVYLDIIGRIPTLKEFDKFMTSKESNRRNQLIDQLFESDGYVSNSFNYWSDVLRAKNVRRTNMDNYFLWIKKSVKDNKPYDQFVRELIASEGSLHEKDNGATGYYMRDLMMPLDNLSNTMQVFLGTSMVCAQCHDHPYKKWTQMDFYKLAAFTNKTFANTDDDDFKIKGLLKKKQGDREQKIGLRPIYQGVYNSGTGMIKLPSDYDYDDAKPNEEVKAGVPYGPKVNIDFNSTNGAKERVYKFRYDKKGFPKNINSRKFFAEWITSRENPMFTKTIVNRLWDRVWGAPLIGGLLDFKESEMGANPKLTEFLVRVMGKVNYDTKLFMKLIYRTKAYQRQLTQEIKGKHYFEGPVMQRLKAEKIWDSLLSIRVENPDKKSLVADVVPDNLIHAHLAKLTNKEKANYIAKIYSEKKKVLSKKNGLKVQGRTPKGGQDFRASEWHYPTEPGTMLQAFGASNRETIDGSFQEANIPQALAMMNDDNYAFNKTSLSHALKKAKSMKEKIKMVYKAVLCRIPTSSELSIIKKYTSKDNEIESIFWALLNSHEFKLRK